MISLCFLLLIIIQLLPFIEIAKEGIPLPFGNKFWASNWPTGKSPLPGLIMHLIPSVSPCVVLIAFLNLLIAIYRQVIIILGPPPSVAYPFILDVEGYPQQIINFFIVCVSFFVYFYGGIGVEPRPSCFVSFTGSFLVKMEEAKC